MDYDTRSVVSSGFINFPLSEAMHIMTHITSEELLTGDVGYTRIRKEFSELVKYCHKPVLIAHNGNSFDHVFL